MGWHNGSPLSKFSSLAYQTYPYCRGLMPFLRFGRIRNEPAMSSNLLRVWAGSRADDDVGLRHVLPALLKRDRNATELGRQFGCVLECAIDDAHAHRTAAVVEQPAGCEFAHLARTQQKHFLVF